MPTEWVIGNKRRTYEAAENELDKLVVSRNLDPAVDVLLYRAVVVDGRKVLGQAESPIGFNAAYLGAMAAAGLERFEGRRQGLRLEMEVNTTVDATVRKLGQAAGAAEDYGPGVGGGTYAGLPIRL
jgi:hypothetical protein